MAQIGIIGGGNLGANTAFFAAEKDIGDVRLYDLQEGVPIGKALDMMEAAPVRGYQYGVLGTNDLSEALACDVIIVAAGAKRSPGDKRADLLGQNESVVREIAEGIRNTDAVVIVATEPVDSMTKLLHSTSGLPWQRVLGVGGLLDSLRLKHLIAAELHTDPADVAATVVGLHSNAMVVLTRYTSVAGVPVDMLISQDRLVAIFEEVRNAGDTILELAVRSTAYYGPAAAATDLAEAIVRDTKRVLPVSFVLSGQLGIRDLAMSLPAVVGAAGIERVLEPRLTGAEEKALRSSI